MAEKNDFIRNKNVMIAVAIAATVIIGFVAYTWLKAPDKDVSSHIARVNGGTNKTGRAESEHYAKQLNSLNHDRATKAESEDESYLSVLDTQPEHVDVAPIQTTPKPQMQSFHRAVAPTEHTSRQDERQQSDQQKRIEQQTVALLASWTPSKPVDATVSKSGDEYIASIIPASYSTSSEIQDNRHSGNGNANSSSGNDAQKGPNQKVVQDYTLVAGELDTDLDSDENSVVVATIQSGQWEGGKCFADGYKLMTNSIDMTFSRMVWNGHTYTIKAKPVDSTTGRTSLSGDVDHHYFSRIIVPAIAEAISKGGQIYEDSYGQTTVSDGVVIQDNEKPDNDQIVGAAIGGFGDAAAGVLKSDAGRMPSRTVTVPKGTTIGIQFMGAVYESDDADLKKEQMLVPQTQPASQNLLELQQKDNQYQAQTTLPLNDRRQPNIFVSGN